MSPTWSIWTGRLLSGRQRAVYLLVIFVRLFACGECSQLVGRRLLRVRAPGIAPAALSGAAGDAVQPLSSLSARNAPATNAVENHKDVQFAIEVKLGGQRMYVMLDTGSYRLTVTSKRCPESECPHRAFNPAASKTYKQHTKKTESSFGTGHVWEQEAVDELQFGAYGPRHQEFWEILKLDQSMHDLWNQTQFDGILGLSWRKTVPDAGNETTVLEHFQVDAFTVCLGRSSGWSAVQSSGRTVQVLMNGVAGGTPSRIYWGRDGAQNLGHFARMEVLGDQHWAVNLSNISVLHKMQGLQKLACWDEPCAAVIDTGSSVLSAPKHHVSRLRRALGVKYGCSNWANLPDLHFHLGGKGTEAGVDVVLPARSYAKHVQLKAVTASSHDENKSVQEPLITEICEPRLGDSTFLNADIAVWILGVPFLQEYVCEFDRSRFPAQVGIAAHPGICPGSTASEAEKHLGALSVGAELASQGDRDSAKVSDKHGSALPDARALLGVHV